MAGPQAPEIAVFPVLMQVCHWKVGIIVYFGLIYRNGLGHRLWRCEEKTAMDMMLTLPDSPKGCYRSALYSKHRSNHLPSFHGGINSVSGSQELPNPRLQHIIRKRIYILDQIPPPKRSDSASNKITLRNSDWAHSNTASSFRPRSKQKLSHALGYFPAWRLS